MKKFLLPSIICIFLIFTASRPRENVKEVTLSPQKDSLKSALVLYGEHIFLREGCGKCHSEGNSYIFVSLEGIANKYPNAWHYAHLQNPQSASPYSSMRPYPNLFTQEMNKKTLKEIIEAARKKGRNYPKNFEETAINQLFVQSSLLAKELEENNIKNPSLEKKEVIAVIAYLQQLPSREERWRADSIEKAKNDFAEALLFETNKKIVMPFALSNHKDTIEMGKTIFERSCTPCHGKKGEGLVGPNLTDAYWLHGGKVEDLLNTVQKGVVEKGMPAWKNVLSASDMGKVVCYVRSLKGSTPENAKEPQGVKE